jgi:hypothetical protein
MNDISVYLITPFFNMFDVFRIFLLLIVYTTLFIEFDRKHRPDVPSETTATFLVFGVRCVGLHCHVEGSRLATNSLLQSLEQHC